MATGDNDADIRVWERSEAGEWAVSPTPYQSHTASVEDIAWSPGEPNVFTSASVRTPLIYSCLQLPP